jgi:hypothetical protein
MRRVVLLALFLVLLALFLIVAGCGPETAEDAAPDAVEIEGVNPQSDADLAPDATLQPEASLAPDDSLLLLACRENEAVSTVFAGDFFINVGQCGATSLVAQPSQNHANLIGRFTLGQA